MLSVFMMSVVMPSVVAPSFRPFFTTGVIVEISTRNLGMMSRVFNHCASEWQITNMTLDMQVPFGRTTDYLSRVQGFETGYHWNMDGGKK
jgi:hypothetical protein